MADFDQVLDPGDYQNGVVNTVSEIPQGSMLKIEWDTGTKAFMLDRVEPAVFAKPVGYGFIPQTLDEDGDGLDTLIVCSEPVPTGVWLKAQIIGIMNFEDDGEMDHKVVVVPADDRDMADSVKNLEDLGEGWRRKVEHHFNHYKDFKKPNSTKVLGWGDVEEAKMVIAESIKRFTAK